MSEERSRYGLDTLGQNTEDVLAALGLLPGLSALDSNINLGIGERLFDVGVQERQQGVEQVEFDREEAARQQEAIFAILELILRGGTSPTFGVAGGFDLGAPSAGSGGFLGGIMDAFT